MKASAIALTQITVVVDLGLVGETVGAEMRNPVTGYNVEINGIVKTGGRYDAEFSAQLPGSDLINLDTTAIVDAARRALESLMTDGKAVAPRDR